MTRNRTGSIDDEFLHNIGAENWPTGRSGTDIGQEIVNNSGPTPHQSAVFVVEAAFAYPGYVDQLS